MSCYFKVFTKSLMIIIGLLAFGCQSKNNADQRVIYKNLQTVKQYFQSAFTQNYPLLDELLPENVLFMGPKREDTLNKKSLIESWKRLHQNFDVVQARNVKYYIMPMRQHKQTILYYYEAHFREVKTSKWINFRVHVKFIFVQNKMHRLYIFVNQADIINQMNKQKG